MVTGELLLCHCYCAWGGVGETNLDLHLLPPRRTELKVRISEL